VPWRKPWRARGGARNLVTGKPYRGINALTLGCTAYTSPWWVTYRQAKKLGGHVRKGEHGSLVVFWRWRVVEDKETGETKTLPLLRYYTAFNAEQCEGLKVPPIEDARPIEPIAEAERIAAGMPNPPRINHGGDKAYYSPIADHVQMPPRETFEKAPEYYSTLFHELTHSTGHPSRIGRNIGTAAAAFGSEPYSREELVAEMGAAFLCGEAGIVSETLANSAAYIGGWLRALRNDKRLVVMAAAQAQKAADYVLGRQGREETGEAAEAA
jgi:antirestriction protein ArdC